jgi:hypothetical protein
MQTARRQVTAIDVPREHFFAFLIARISAQRTVRAILIFLRPATRAAGR